MQTDDIAGESSVTDEVIEDHEDHTVNDFGGESIDNESDASVS